MLPSGSLWTGEPLRSIVQSASRSMPFFALFRPGEIELSVTVRLVTEALLGCRAW